ncbi:MAG TPA: hypothetical protein VFO93_18420 [Hymenobacter sp.]|uniref:hypothetical protein n=1 Tax=Hymenobacter sp. TaxID=1898978 RepID=UPI002D7EAB2E|nr:hypothetical protein [Hymenobacter sp.]HET9505525.1 hypothetical protein [Hymenobacter sp.]
MKNLFYSALLLLAGSGCHAQPSTDYSAPAYRATLQRFDQRRTALAARYRQAATPAARATCLAEARDLWLTALDSTVFPAWESTPWSFYGHSWEPRQGSIACGYFVTTALHDAGLRLPRTLLAKQAATVIIRNLTTEAHMHRYRGISQAAFVQQMRQLGPGLYVLGLDYHVGFLRVREGGAVQMVHSSYTGAGGVVREAADASAALESQARVVGKISDDTTLLRAWLLGTPLVARGCTVKS